MAFQPPQHVVVIGGGIVGSSIAWHLSHSTTTKTTIVAGKIGGVATPNSFAWINAGSTDRKFYYDFRRRSMDRWRQIEREVPGLSGYIRWGGGTTWDIEDEDERAEEGRRLASWGYDVVVVNKSEIPAYEPALSESVLPNWALRLGSEGQMEAHIVAEKLFEAADTNGASILEANATSFVKKGGRIAGVVLAGGEVVEADHVIVAAGVGSVELLATENVTLPVTGQAGLLANTHPTKTRFLNDVVYATDVHMRQTADGRIRFGAHFGGGPPGDDPEATAAELFASLKGALTESDELEYDYYTIGYRPQPVDDIPILGETGVEGLTVAVMHSGVSNGALVGELLSKQVLTGEKDPALSNFSLSRFSDATVAARRPGARCE